MERNFVGDVVSFIALILIIGLPTFVLTWAHLHLLRLVWGDRVKVDFGNRTFIAMFICLVWLIPIVGQFLGGFGFTAAFVIFVLTEKT